MRKVDVAGRAVQDLDGLKQSLESAGFQVAYCEAATGVIHSVDGAGPILKSASKESLSSGPYTRVFLQDAETKDPIAIITSFKDEAKKKAPKEILLESSDGTVWTVTVDDSGKLSAKQA